MGFCEMCSKPVIAPPPYPWLHPPRYCSGRRQGAAVHARHLWPQVRHGQQSWRCRCSRAGAARRAARSMVPALDDRPRHSPGPAKTGDEWPRSAGRGIRNAPALSTTPGMVNRPGVGQGRACERLVASVAPPAIGVVDTAHDVTQQVHDQQRKDRERERDIVTHDDTAGTCWRLTSNQRSVLLAGTLPEPSQA